MKKLVLLSLVALIFTVSAQAETIFQQFSSDPTAGSWTTTGTNSTWTYNGAGYLTARFKSDTAAQRYYTTLASSVTSGTEFWMSMDVKLNAYTTTSHTNVCGVYNSSSSNNKSNTLGDSFAYINTSTNRYTVYGNYYDSAGTRTSTTAYNTNATWVGYASDMIVRIKTHNMPTLNKAQIDIYQLGTDGSETLIMSTSYSPSSNLNVASSPGATFNQFGLGDLTSSTSAATVYQEFLVDNMYFSTDHADTNTDLPSFIPEPATLALLGLGALVLRRKK